MLDIEQSSNPDHLPIYQITVEGYLDEGWSAWFSDMTITCDSHSAAGPITTLTGPVSDQAALRGLLCKLWDLSLTLTTVGLLPAAPATGRRPNQNNN